MLSKYYIIFAYILYKVYCKIYIIYKKKLQKFGISKICYVFFFLKKYILLHLFDQK